MFARMARKNYYGGCGKGITEILLKLIFAFCRTNYFRSD